MPRVKPFYAFIPPLPLLKGVVSYPLEYYSLGQARLLMSENPHHFLHLVDPSLDHPYLRGSRQELIFKKINENLADFLDDQVLIKREQEAMFVYRVSKNEIAQLGLWCLTHIGDYLNGKIKKHEVTVERREQLLANYLQQTGIDANPVLITYQPDSRIDLILQQYSSRPASIIFKDEFDVQHEIWAIDEIEDLQALKDYFEGMNEVYIADGHHRIASIAKMANQMGKSLGKPDSSYHYFSSAYFSANEIRILPFHRLIKDLAHYAVHEFLALLQLKFTLQHAEEPSLPKHANEIGMYLEGKFYRLFPKDEILANNHVVSSLHVIILQDYILNPILGIVDPRTDARVTFEGGNIELSDILKKVDQGIYAVAFLLYPTSVDQLIAVADANAVMPPKSTYVEPKFLLGLLSHLL